MRTAFDRTHVKLSAPIERSDSHRTLTCRAFSFENRDDIQHYSINSLSKFGIESSIVHSLKAFRGSEEGNLKVENMIGVPTAFDTLCPGEVTPTKILSS